MRAENIRPASIAWLWILCVALLPLAGCATFRKERTATFPEEAFITHRAVLSARGGKQFTFNGYLSQSATRGQRLILMESFGTVLADLLIRPSGEVHVLRAAPAIKPVLLERYVARDIQCIFKVPAPDGCKVTEVSPKHFRVKRWMYTLDLHVLEVKAGQQPDSMFHTDSSGTKP
jgi:hypothetical protein